MTWHMFLAGYVAIAVTLLVIPIAPLRLHRLRAIRAMLASFAISFFIDYPGEHRPLWRFHEPSVFLVLDVPIENMIFIAASVPYILTLYLGAQSLLRRPSARS